MKHFNYNNCDFFKFDNLLNNIQKEKIKKDIDYQIKYNLCVTVPPYQTYNNLHQIYKNDKTWDFLFKKITSCVESTTKKKLIKLECWANVSKENNNYDFHSHISDLTAVYYLQNKYPEYGTNIENNIIINAFENTLIVFNGKLHHSVVNMPLELVKNNYRYSVVVDFNYVRH